MLIYINYIYRVYIIGDFAAYPEPVAAKLRRALYYTNIDLQPKNAIKYYRQALALADEIGKLDRLAIVAAARRIVGDLWRDGDVWHEWEPMAVPIIC